MNLELRVEKAILDVLKNETDWALPEYISFKLQSERDDLKTTTASFLVAIGRLVERGDIESIVIRNASHDEKRYKNECFCYAFRLSASAADDAEEEE